MPPSSFPKFADGDLKIAVIPDIYLLHSTVLKNRPGLLRVILGSRHVGDPSSTPAEHHRSTPSRRLHLHLTGMPGHKYGMLDTLGYEDNRGDMDDMYLSSFPEWPLKTRHVWSNIFRIVYNLHPTLDYDGHDFLLDNCQALLELAEELQLFDIVSTAMHTSLLSFDQQLYQLIAKDTIGWIKLGVRLQSGAIFKESMIHLVGKWNLLDEEDRSPLPANIHSLCVRKVQELQVIKQAIDLQMVNKLPRPRSDSSRHRETKNIFGWMALTFYQQWLCESFATNRNHHAPDGGAAFYRAIAAGGDAYLSKLDRDITQFQASLDAIPESNKGLKELEKDLNELKKGMKGFVADLLVNEAKYDTDILGDLPYLTCCKVREEELPQTELVQNGMVSQYLGIDGNIDTDLLNNNSFSQPFVSSGSTLGSDGAGVVMGINASSEYLETSCINQDYHHPTPFNPFNNTFNEPAADLLFTWSGAQAGCPAHFPVSPFNVGMSSSTDSLRQLPLPALSDDIYHPQPQSQMYAPFIPTTGLNDLDMDFLNEHFSPEGDTYVHDGSDGSMAFL
ncbi:uncharacterized protein BDV14DRAFT_203431 [Aspergillus stella-maris]|uniref:uncharacterized protein n=1 Tax=Aspergillus stella-maris TaxID=1810926 RepID=UPI003CCE3767